MADKKISALPAATTPLAGTEVLPIVQSGTTDKVSVANLTAGRAVSASSFTASSLTANRVTYAGTAGLLQDSANYTFNGTTARLSGPRGTYTMEYYNSNDGSVAGRMGTISGNIFNIDATGASNIMTLSSNGTEALRVTAAADISLPNNLVQGTAAKGVNFTANTPAAGMTSQLLNWYEEGTWTPVLYSGATDATMNGVTSGIYTRIGRVVHLHMWIQTTTLNGIGGGQISLKGLPFTINSGYAGYAGATVGYSTNLSITAGQSVVLRPNAGGTTMGILIWDAATGTSNMTGTQWTDTGQISASLSYFV